MYCVQNRRPGVSPWPPLLPLAGERSRAEAGALTKPRAERYQGWDAAEGRAILEGKRTLAELADRALATGLNPQPRSGRQEYLEGLVNTFV